MSWRSPDLQRQLNNKVDQPILIISDFHMAELQPKKKDTPKASTSIKPKYALDHHVDLIQRHPGNKLTRNP